MVQILVTADTLDELTEAYWADEKTSRGLTVLRTR
jgi:hypothetical protein